MSKEAEKITKENFTVSATKEQKIVNISILVFMTLVCIMLRGILLARGSYYIANFIMISLMGLIVLACLANVIDVCGKKLSVKDKKITVTKYFIKTNHFDIDDIEYGEIIKKDDGKKNNLRKYNSLRIYFKNGVGVAFYEIYTNWDLLLNYVDCTAGCRYKNWKNIDYYDL